MPRRAAKWWQAPFVVVVLVICYQAFLVGGAHHGLLKIPLFKQKPSNAVRLPSRLAHQQARVRRRALEEAGKGYEDFSMGEIALSESLLGVGFGTHYAELYLGIPAQRASVIVDTGSHITALPCSTCTDCGEHTDPLYNVSKSTTAKYLACHEFGSCNSCEEDRCLISQSYIEGSMWQAVVVDELIWVGGLSSLSDEIEGVLRTFGFRFPVGCQTKETGLFITQKENGIMGLGRHSMSVMSYMLKADRVTHDVFTLCFAGDGGELAFGGVDYSHHTSAVAYTPLLDDHSAYYTVHVKDIMVNGVSIGIDEKTINSGNGVIVDSGTTDSFFDAAGNRNFMKAFQNAVGGRDYSEKSMKLSDDDFATLPIISVVLSGMKGDGSDDVQLDIPAYKYLSQSNDGSFYGNFHFSERSGGVLGSSTMIGLNVIFDRENSRIGFAESTCGKKRGTNASNISSTAPDIAEYPVPGNASTSSPTNSSAMKLNVTATISNDTVGSIDTIPPNSSINVTSRNENYGYGVFIAETLLISLVGVALGVVVWTKWRVRAWSRIPESSSRAHVGSIVDIIETGSLSPLSPPGSPSSPRSRGARKALSPKFTIGSSGEEDVDERHEGSDSPIILGGPRFT